jgi:hypothetical protein
VRLAAAAVVWMMVDLGYLYPTTWKQLTECVWAGHASTVMGCLPYMANLWGGLVAPQ